MAEHMEYDKTRFYWLGMCTNCVHPARTALTTPLTDHNAKSIFIPPHSAFRLTEGSAYGKLNSSLLQHETVITDV